MPELKNVAPRKFVTNNPGAVPTLDISSGIRVGDFVTDESISPHKVFQCVSNAAGAAVYTQLGETGGATLNSVIAMSMSI